MEAIIIAIRTFMEAGGDVLWLIAAATFVMWALIFERALYINTEHKKDVGRALAYWEGRDERTSWHAHMIRLRLISEVNQRLSANLSFIKTLISLLPLLGLLGTVTGMVHVFDVLAVTGTGNARAMANGISQATIPTMAGLVVALTGLYFHSRLID